MYIRVVRGHADPGREQEVTNIVQSSLIPAYRNLPGFQGYQGGVDRESGALVSITTWDTKEHAGFDRTVLADAASQLQGVGVQLEPSEVYEVTIGT